MKKGIGRKSLILREQCLKKGEETFHFIFTRIQKSLRLCFLPLLLSRIVCTSLGIIWTVFVAKKFEKVMCMQLQNMYMDFTCSN